MLEYFLFSMAYSPILSGNVQRPEALANSATPYGSLHIPNALSKAFAGAQKLVRTGNQEGIYQEVLKDILEFFLPKHAPSDDKENKLAKTNGILSRDVVGQDVFSERCTTLIQSS